MTILWCGGEDIDFQKSSMMYSFGYNDSDFSRVSVVSYSYGTSNDISGYTSAWLTCRRTAAYATYANIPFVGVVDSDLGAGIWFGSHPTSRNKISIYKYDGTTWTVVASEDGESLTNYGIKQKIDMCIEDYGSDSSISLYIDGSIVLSYSGDITISGIAEFNSVGIIGSNDRSFISEIILADEDTRLMRLKTLAPSAAGDTNNWLGTYADIDETVISDSDLIYSGTPNAEFQCNLSNLPSGNYQIKAVKVAARQNNNTGFGTQIGIKTNGTVNLAAAQQSVGTWGTKEVLYQVNPVTGQSFTMDEVNALQFAAKHVVV